MVIVKHHGKYSTLYAHQSRIAAGITKGSKISQGQLLGYVGSTGWATGPHLHYEFRVDNQPIDPLSVDLPVALTAWELPGQLEVPDRERVFESMLTVDPDAVRTAARVCANVANRAGAAEAAPALYALADQPGPESADLAAVSAMLGRVLTYVDRFGAA